MANANKNFGGTYEKNKLKTKDLIYAGAFAAIYVIALMIIVMAFGMIPVLYIMSPFFVGMIAATIYMMYVTKVKKFGAILILAVIGAGIGVVIASKLFKKHFEKAGIV
ncbi:MAG: MptD family putative ECF transporter S component [Clostridia bacterium]